MIASDMLPTNGAGVLRRKLQRVLARAAELIVEIDSGVRLEEQEELLEEALFESRKADAFLTLLEAAGVLRGEVSKQARALVTTLAETLFGRLVKCEERLDGKGDRARRGASGSDAGEGNAAEPSEAPPPGPI